MDTKSVDTPVNLAKFYHAKERGWIESNIRVKNIPSNKVNTEKKSGCGSDLEKETDQNC